MTASDLRPQFHRQISASGRTQVDELQISTPCARIRDASQRYGTLSGSSATCGFDTSRSRRLTPPAFNMPTATWNLSLRPVPRGRQDVVPGCPRPASSSWVSDLVIIRYHLLLLLRAAQQRDDSTRSSRTAAVRRSKTVIASEPCGGHNVTYPSLVMTTRPSHRHFVLRPVLSMWRSPPEVDVVGHCLVNKLICLECYRLSR